MSGAEAKPRWGDQARDQKAMAIHATLVEVCGPQVAGGTWLDVGCGSGGIAAGLASRVERVFGVDPEPWPTWPDLMAAHANLILQVGGFDAEIPPRLEKAVDVVICNQVYEHVRNPAQLVRNLGRVVGSKGVCYFAGPNLLWPVEPHVFWPAVHWMPRRFAQRLMTALGSDQAKALDAFSAPSWRLRRWFRQSGFEVRCALRERLVVELRARGHLSLAVAMGLVPRWIYRLLEPVAPGFVYVLTKDADRQGHP